MPRLDWISDAALEREVRTLLQRSGSAYSQAGRRIVRNVIDPFSSLVVATTLQDVNLATAQQISSATQGISNAVGDFHQQVLGSIAGFVDHDAGYDLESVDKQIIAEVKNKHNTMNAGSRRGVVSDLDTALRQKRGAWTAYLVIIVPKKPHRYKEQLTQRQVYETDGASFYALATGSQTALHDLYHAVEDIASRICPHIRANGTLGYCQEALHKGIPE